MDSVISYIIPQQNFEKIHNRIGEILVVELDRQSVMSYDTDLDVTIYKERAVPFAPSELPAVNVLLWKGDYDGQTQLHTNGVYRYIIELTMNAKYVESGETDNDKRSDAIAMSKVQKVMGKIRAILEEPKYKTLGFVAPFLGNRHIESMAFMKHPHQDANTSCIGRLVFSVMCPESNQPGSTILLGGNDTTVKLHETEVGYIWTMSE